MNFRAIGMIFLVALLLITTSVYAEEKPFLSYSNKGGRAWVDVKVLIDQGTRFVTVEEIRQASENKKEIIRHQTVLTEAEQADLVTRIRKSGFFKPPTKEKSKPKPHGHMHAGTSILTISLDGKKHSKTYGYAPALFPVEQLLHQLIVQARAMHSLRPEGNAYDAKGAVNPRLSGGKALQPAIFKKPLLDYFRTQKDLGRAKSALEGLAYVTTPIEYSKIVVEGLKDGSAGRDNLLQLIGSHPFTGNIPKEHLKALYPVYLDYIVAAGMTHKLEGNEAQAFDQCLYRLGCAHYQAAIPILVKGFEARTRRGVSTNQTPLSKMGEAGLKAVFPYLSSAVPAHRENAIELLVIASRDGPNCGHSYPNTEAEYREMKLYFESSIIPKLAEIEKSDSSEAKQVKEAIKEIRSWLAK